MKKPRLMPGDWVGMDLNDLPDNFFEVLEVGDTMKLKGNVPGETGFYSILDLEPIPLTLEIIGKWFGWEEINGAQYKKTLILRGAENEEETAIYCARYFDCHMILVTVGSITIDLEYVHEFQHFIESITGEPLERNQVPQ